MSHGPQRVDVRRDRLLRRIDHLPERVDDDPELRGIAGGSPERRQHA
jgi:hypothetical protein